MGIELGNLAVLRTFRVLRALKTVAIVPGKYEKMYKILVCPTVFVLVKNLFLHKLFS